MKLPWPILSLLAMMCFSVMIILMTFIGRRGVSVPFMLLGISIVCIPLFYLHAASTGGFSQLTGLSIAILIIISILSAIGNIAQFEAMKASPNPGLPLTIVGFYSALVAVIAVFVFKDKLTIMQIIGIITALVGVSLISLSGKA
jgi:drug/metabolite transporter (DMT)-like permease